MSTIVLNLIKNHADLLNASTSVKEIREHGDAIYQLAQIVGGMVQPEDYISPAMLKMLKIIRHA